MKFLLAEIRHPAFLVIDLKDTFIVIQDGDSPVNSITVKIGEGNLTYAENRNVEYILDRGRLDEVRLGDEVPMDVTFDFVWEYITGDTSPAGPPTVEDALKQRGQAATWVSTDADLCRPYAVDMILQHVPNCATGDQEFITFPDFRWDSLDHDLRGGAIAVTGRCNTIEASPVRSAQSAGSP
jgi:hypothetical protein